MEEQASTDNVEKDKDEFTARAYQVELYETAISQNTIIYLPTGAGKTFIAIMMLKKLSGDIQKPYSEDGKRTIFIVNTVPLVTQQSEYIARHTGLMCKGYSGDLQVDYWSEEKWLAELNAYQVLVMTSQIFLDILCHGYMQLEKVNLIIFDECHRAVEDHPMRLIMQRFQSCPVDQQPRVLALSATLLNANIKVDKVQSTIESLETTFHAKIATVNSSSYVQKYATNPIEKIILFDTYIPPSSVLVQMKGLFTSTYEILKVVNLKSAMYNEESSVEFRTKSKSIKLKNILDDVHEQLIITGIYGAFQAMLLRITQLECIKRCTDDEVTLSVLQHIITQLIKMRKVLYDDMQEYTEFEQIMMLSSPQVKSLIALIKDFHQKRLEDQKFYCIIFVKRRFTAQVLYFILKKLNSVSSEYNFLLPEYILGNSNDPYKSIREALCCSKWNKEALQRFRNGQSNCIISTDVLDEGIDIPNCTLIVRFDPPMDFRSYVQSKGRARHKTSQYVIMLNKGDADNYSRRYQSYKKIEEYMKQLLVGKTAHRQEPTAERIKRELYDTQLQPYSVTNEKGIESIITECSAVALVNRYCSTLLKSKFVHLAPTWVLYKLRDGYNQFYKVTLKLPIISPLREVISGDPMQSINSAKRSVALKACEKLHQIGELNDNLVPSDFSDISSNVDYLFPHWEEESETEDGTLPGTTRRKRLHPYSYPKELYGAYPVPDAPLFLHVLQMVPTYPPPYDKRHLTFYELLNSREGFGILSTKEMPKLNSFPIFMNVGELKVDVQVNIEIKPLNEGEINMLRTFHTIIFGNVVPILKNFMVFDKENCENSFLIVPVTENCDISWAIVQRYQKMPPEKIPPSKPIHVTHAKYETALVAPNYRASSSVYIVTQICDDVKPESSFPTDQYYSYVHYYLERHGMQICDTKQPMLEVKPISTNINCIKPRSIKPGLSKRKRADLLEEFDEHLVPELCDIIDFSALYWLKATTLPSILHRVLQLLIAEDLRATIAREHHLGVTNVTGNSNWSHLEATDREVEETEPTLDQTYDEGIDVCQQEPELTGPEVDVLNSEANLYPWKREEEPPDVERNIEKIQLIDIEYYQQFMTAKVDNSISIVPHNSKIIEYRTKPDVIVTDLPILSKSGQQGPEPSDVMKALTTKMGNDMFNLERLETLGDSFLKFITSLYLYQSFPMYTEGRLTAMKGKIIGNRNLYYCGNSKGIPGRIKIDEFEPKSNFIPPCYTAYRPLQKSLLKSKIPASVLYELSIPLEERLSGFVSDDTLATINEKVSKFSPSTTVTGMEHFLNVQYVPDKTVADCVEALIGVYLLSMGLAGATRLLTWFGILPNSLVVTDILSGQPANPVIGTGNVDSHMPWADRMEKTLGYKFKNRAYLLQAFTHPSYTANGITECYQRLEFLGDAIIDFLVTTHIYETGEALSPGELTDLRSALVNNITFACLAVRYGLHTALLSYAPNLNDIIDRFVKFQEERNHVISDDLLFVLLEEEECNMAEYVDVPKVLGDLLESVIGAIYLDSGKNIKQTWEILYALMHKEIDLFMQDVPKQPVRVLYETQGARPKFLKTQIIEDTTTVMVPLEVIVDGKIKTFYGFGHAKDQAKRAAAKQALKCLRCKK